MTSRRPLASAWAAMLCGCCVALAAAGCGGAAPARLGDADARALEHELAAVEASASQGDRAATLRRLDALRERLRQLRASGRLAGPAGPAMLRAVAQARASAESELPAPAPPAAVAAPPAPVQVAPPAPAQPQGQPPHRPKHDGPHGHGPGHGHRHGRGPKGGDNGD